MDQHENDPSGDATTHPDPSDRPARYRIGELADLAGTTVRNVRAYQDRGLLPPPRREGRVAIYSDEHMARLRLVTELLDRGYSLANIAELLEAWQAGQDLGELLGFETALAGPWTDDEEPTTITRAELAELLGTDLGDDLLERSARLGVVRVRGDVVHVSSPRTLDAGAAMVRAGVPVEAVVRHAEELRADMERIAGRFVDLAVTELVQPLGPTIPAAEIPRLTELVVQLRSLARRVVDVELSRALQRELRARLGEGVDRLGSRRRSTEEPSDADVQDAGAPDASARGTGGVRRGGR